MNKKGIYISMNILAVVTALLFFFPTFWIVMSTLKHRTELFTYPLTIFPEQLTFINFYNVLKNDNFLLYFKNSTFITVTATAITVFINTLAGFAFAKYKFRGRDFIFLCLLSATMLPTEAIMNSSFTVIQKLGLYNSLWGAILPTVATPTGVFIMRQFFMEVPDSLIEACRIDGASEFQIFTLVALPLAKPVIAALTVFSFMWRWNDFIWPLISLSDPKKFTIPLIISNYAGELSIDWSSLLAASVISMIPVLIVFLVFQNYFIKGIANTGSKE
ncbi:MAG: carbohydrate ABC transporter permease [Cetobacterium sp.]